MAIDLSRLLIFWKTRDCGQNRFEPIRLLRKSNFSLSSKIARRMQPRERSRAILDFPEIRSAGRNSPLSNLP
jgi:hypothetical protein